MTIADLSRKRINLRGTRFGSPSCLWPVAHFAPRGCHSIASLLMHVNLRVAPSIGKRSFLKLHPCGGCSALYIVHCPSDLLFEISTHLEGCCHNSSSVRRFPIHLRICHRMSKQTTAPQEGQRKRPAATFSTVNVTAEALIHPLFPAVW